VKAVLNDPAYSAHTAADLSRVTDTLTDTANNGKNSQHLMLSMQPKNKTKMNLNNAYATARLRPLAISYITLQSNITSTSFFFLCAKFCPF